MPGCLLVGVFSFFGEFLNGLSLIYTIYALLILGKSCGIAIDLS